MGDFNFREFFRGLAQEPEPDELPGDVLPVSALDVLADAVSGELVVAPFADLVGFGAGVHFDEVVEPEAVVRPGFLPDADDARKEFLRRDGSVIGFPGRLAVVAAAAAFVGPLLAEVGEEKRSSAFVRFRVVNHPLQLIAGDLLFLWIGLFVDERPLLNGISGAEEQEALAWESVTTGAAGFLIIALDVFWEIVMDDVADVGLVDSHAEGDGRRDDAHFVAKEEFLVARALGGSEAGVIGERLDSVLAQFFGDAFGGFPAETVDDPAFVAAFANKFEDLVVGFDLRSDPVGEIGSVEARHINLGVV